MENNNRRNSSSHGDDDNQLTATTSQPSYTATMTSTAPGTPPPAVVPAEPITTPKKILYSLLSGAIAGALAKTTIAPLDRTKIYFQTTPSAPFSTPTVLLYLHRTYLTTGFLSLFRGNSATMARIVPYSAIQFTAHEQFKHLLSPLSVNNPQSTRFLAGSLAGVTAQSLTYPLDLTRARLAVSPKHKYKNLKDVFRKTIKTDGVIGLYKGYVPTMLGVVPYAGFSFFTYESVKYYYKEIYKDDPPGLVRLAGGAVSGVVGQSCSYPLDIVRRRMQVGGLTSPGGGGNTVYSSGSLGVWGMLKRIYAKEGLVGGLYKGLSMNWIKGPVAAGISFSVFDWCNAWFLRKNWI